MWALNISYFEYIFSLIFTELSKHNVFEDYSSACPLQAPFTGELSLIIKEPSQMSHPTFITLMPYHLSPELLQEFLITVSLSHFAHILTYPSGCWQVIFPKQESMVPFLCLKTFNSTASAKRNKSKIPLHGEWGLQHTNPTQCFHLTSSYFSYSTLPCHGKLRVSSNVLPLLLRYSTCHSLCLECCFLFCPNGSPVKF
jgi:hypothetical protein